MVGQELDLLENESYNIVAQIYAILIENAESSKPLSQEKLNTLKKVLKQDFNINYRIPKNEFVPIQLVNYSVLELAFKIPKRSFDEKYLDIFQLLIDHGVDFTSQNANYETILHQLVKSNKQRYFNKSKSYYDLRGKLCCPLADVILSAHVKLTNTSNPSNKNGISHFHIACMFNHTAAVKYFLDQGTDVNQPINSNSFILLGYTPLHLAVRYSAFETLELLLEHNANANLKDAQSMYPLYVLIQRKQEILDLKNLQKKKLSEQLKDELLTNEKMILIFLERTRINEIELSNYHLACTLQDTSMIERLLADGSINLKNSVKADSLFWPGYTALHFAAHFNIDSMKLLLKHGANITAKDADGKTPFDLCLPRYSINDIHSIIENVAEWKDITFIDKTTKLSDLILSMADENTFQSFFKETGININVSLPNGSPLWPGYTILHITVVLSENVNHIEFSSKIAEEEEYEYWSFELDMLDHKGIDLDSWSADWYTIRNARKNREYFKRIELCLDMGADVTITNTEDFTPLHLAFQLQNWYVVDLLLRYYHKIVNIIVKDIQIHLHIACVNCIMWGVFWADPIKNLLKLDVNVNSPIMSNFKCRFIYRKGKKVLHIISSWTYLHMSIASGNDLLAKSLLENGADLYAEDSNGMTPIHHALQAPSIRNFDEVFLSEGLKNCTTSFGLSHLHVACFYGNLKAIERLLDQGADIEATVDYSQISSIKDLKFLAPYDGYTPFHFIFRDKRPENRKTMELMIQRGANAFAQVSNGITPVYKALREMLEFNYYDDFAELLVAGNSLQKLMEDTIGLTSLHVACLTMKIKEVKKLLSSGANPNAQVHADSPIYSGCTPFHLLMINCCIKRTHDYDYSDYIYPDGTDCQVQLNRIKKIGMLLYEHGASIMIRDAQGNTPIHKAFQFLQRGLLDNNIEWILQGHIDFTSNPIGFGGISHFDMACLCGNEEAIRRFLESGVDVNRPPCHFINGFSGATPIQLALMKGISTSLIELMLKQGANIEAKDFLDNTPLHIFTRYQYNDMFVEAKMKLLIEAGADINAKNCWNETPMTVLCNRISHLSKALVFVLANVDCCLNLFSSGYHTGVLEELWPYEKERKSLEDQLFYKAIIKSPHLNGVDEMGRTIIHNIVSTKNYNQSSAEEYTEIICAFIKLGFDVDYQDNEGQTALHKASVFGNVSGIIGLLTNGANINITDARHKTALSSDIPANTTSKTYLKILRVFAYYIHKMQIVGLKINDDDKELASQITVDVDEVKRCDEELKRLKNYYISSSSVSLYEFLSKTYSYLHLMRSHRDNLHKIFEANIKDLRAEFPQFVGLLLMQYRNVFIRSYLIDQAKIALKLVTKFPFPDLCSDEIVSYLYNKDLQQLITLSVDV